MNLSFGSWRIRPFRFEDADALVKYADNPNVAANLRDRFPHPYTLVEAHAWLEHTAAQAKPMTFAIASEHEVIGGIGLEPQEDIHFRSAELGYWLGEPFWGQGIMTQAVSVFTEAAFAHYDLIRIFATAFHTNPGSARVLEKTGFEFEGRLRASVVKNGRIVDQLLYALVRLPEGTEAD